MAELSHFSATIRGCIDGETLFGYLDRFFPYQENTNWQQRVHHLTIDGTPYQVSADLPMENNRQISFGLADYREDPVATDWVLLWQNDDLFAVHKPAPLPMHRTTRHILNTLTVLVRQGTGFPSAQPLHRLDQETAGIVVFAKDSGAAARWQSKFKELLVTKRYRAIVYGNPDWTQNHLTTFLATKPDSPIRCQMHVVEAGAGKQSTTEFQVIRQGAGFAEIECRLITGRKHQIRAQLAHLGHPIVGDKIYANQGTFYLKRLANRCTESDWQNLLAEHHLLMAFQVELQLPDSEVITITDDHWPQAWQAFSTRVFSS